MTRTDGVALALVFLLGAGCAREAPAAQTTAAQPADAEAADPERDAQARAVAEQIAAFEAAHAEESARWTPELTQQAAELAAMRFDDTGTALATILASEHRAPASRARDVHRHPAETLSFFGLQPDSTVVELGAGSGWYTEILAPLLAARGELRAVTFDPDGDPTSMLTAYGKRFALFLSRSPELYGSVQPVYITPPAPPSLGPAASADLVLVVREMHNWHRGGALDAYLASVHEVLKDGGILGVVQHRAPEGADVDAFAEKGYLPQAWLVERVEAAGFELADSSEINANPKDTKDYEPGVWALPPTLRLGDVDRARYEAIGESDRMTLKFRKTAR